jgi:hypothetical protein
MILEMSYISSYIIILTAFTKDARDIIMNIFKETKMKIDTKAGITKRIDIQKLYNKDEFNL